MYENALILTQELPEIKKFFRKELFKIYSAKSAGRACRRWRATGNSRPISFRSVGRNFFACIEDGHVDPISARTLVATSLGPSASRSAIPSSAARETQRDKHFPVI